MLYFLQFLISFSTAHESLVTLKCTDEARTLEVSRGKEKFTVNLQSAGKNKIQTLFDKLSVHDELDPKSQQVFDIHNGVNTNYSLMIKKPETKGPVKKVMASLTQKESQNSWEFKNCQMKTSH